jgi:hypothetical protein
MGIAWIPFLEVAMLTLHDIGYRMAKNLRQKLPNHDTLVVQDINKDASRKFADELSDFTVVVANTARQLAEMSVRHPLSIVCLLLEDEFYSIDDLSWGLFATLAMISPKQSKPIL